MELKNTNILILLEIGGLGGAERQALGLARYLTEEKNCKVDLLLLKSDFQTEEFSEFVKYSKIRNVYHFGEPYLYLPKEFSFKNLRRVKWNISYLLKLRKGLKNNGYTIAIPFLNYTSKIAYCLYKLIPSIKITFWHQLGLDNLKKDIIERYIARHVPFVIGNAPNCLDIFKNEYPIDKNKLNLLPQYISIQKKEFNKEKLREKYKIPLKSVVIGMVAHYRDEKLYSVLIEAFSKISIEDVFLVLLGNKSNSSRTLENYNNYKHLIEYLGLADRVLLLSEKPVEEILNIIDIGVLVSKIEGMPNSVMEYMYYKLPVISTNHPGCKILLGDNSKFLIENNSNVLKEKMELLIKNGKLRKKIGNQNYKIISSYTLYNYVNKLEKIINFYI